MKLFFLMKQPTMPLQIAVMCHPRLLPMAYPGSLLAKDLVMGSLPLPWINATRPVDGGPTMLTASGATNLRTTLVVVHTNVATADTTIRTTCVRNHTFVAHGTTVMSHRPIRAMASSAQLPSLEG